MTHRLPVLAALALLVSACASGEGPTAADPLTAAARRAAPPDMAEAAERRRDPATGTVPSERRWAVLDRLRAEDPSPLRLRREADLYGWVPVDDRLAGMAVTALAHDPNDPSVFYFATGEGWFNADAVRGAGIWKSTDAGATWDRLPSTDTSTFWYNQDLVVHPSGDVYVATRSGGVQRSRDGGATWEQVLGVGNGSVRNTACDLELTADGGVFAGIGIFDTDGIYYSDSGDPGTWTKQTNGFPSAGIWRVEIATAPSDPDVAYAVPVSTDYLIEGTYRTEDRGQTWTAVTNPGGDRRFAARQGWYDLILAVDPTDADHVVAGGLHAWRSRDGGETWQRLSSGRPDSLLTRYMHVDQHNVVFVSPDTVYFTNDGGIYRCDNFTDDEPVIYARNDGYNTTQYYAADIARQAGDPRVLGGTQDNGSTLSLGEGLGPHLYVSGADGSFCNFDHTDADRFYTSKQYQPIYRFDNGGFELPDTLRNPLVDENQLRFINPIEMDPVDPTLLYQASSRGLQRLAGADAASGEGFVQASRNVGEISAIGISVEPPNIVFLGRRTANAEVFRLQDAHLTTADDQPYGCDANDDLPDAGLFGTVTCTSIWVNPTDANHVLVSYGNYGVNSVWESTNALDIDPRWRSVEGDLPDLPVNGIMGHPDAPHVAWVATDLGVWYTDSLAGEATAWRISSSFPTVRTDMLRLRRADGTAVAATHGRGIWTAVLDPTGADNDPVWLERGPTNVGGRTRALMVDPNDPTGETVWAGSVSGGLWRTRGISSVGLPGGGPSAEGPLLTAAPNPFGRAGLDLVLESARAGEGTLELLDLWGRVVAVPYRGVAAPGATRHRFVPGPGLAPGVYLARWRPASGPAVTRRVLYRP